MLPPASYLHEKEKIDKRWPAAVKFIRERKLNEHFGPESGRVGIVMQGGMYNGVMRALQRLGLADIRGRTDVPLYVLNVTYPLIDDEFLDFARDKDAVLVVEEGQPNHIEQAFGAMLHKAGVPTKLFGKDPFPIAGEYTGAIMLDSVSSFRPQERAGPSCPTATGCRTSRPPPRSRRSRPRRCRRVRRASASAAPSGPIFAAMKLVEKELGVHHVAADIGCHLFSILPPFNIGASTMGYGLGPASASAFNVPAKKRPISIMGDGGFWHNGLNSGITNAVFNKHDGVTIIVDNFYSAATGGQDIMSSRAKNQVAPDRQRDHQGGARRRRQMGAPDRPDLRRHLDARHAEGSADDEGEGPENHRRLVGMHAEQAAPREAARRESDCRRQARGEAALRRRRGRLHRRPRLHAPLRLPVAVDEGAGRSAPRRSGRGDRRVLRRLRQLRRGGGRRRALPVLLPRRRDPQSERLRPSSSPSCAPA